MTSLLELSRIYSTLAWTNQKVEVIQVPEISLVSKRERERETKSTTQILRSSSIVLVSFCPGHPYFFPSSPIERAKRPETMDPYYYPDGSSMSISCCLQDWNNRGATCIANGDYSMAISHLSKALVECTKNMLSSVNKSNTPSTTTTQDSTLNDDDKQQKAQQFIQVIRTWILSSPTRETTSGPAAATAAAATPAAISNASSFLGVGRGDCSPGRSIYRHPLFVTSPSSLLLLDQQQYCHAISIAITYNLALTHQLRADEMLLLSKKKQDEDVNEAAAADVEEAYRGCMYKSIKIFRLALELLSQVQLIDDKDYHHVWTCAGGATDLFLLATFNNLAAAHYSLGDMDVARSFFQRIRTIVSLSSEEYPTESIHQESLHDINAFFFESSFDPMLLGRHEGCPAAAA